MAVSPLARRVRFFSPATGRLLLLNVEMETGAADCLGVPPPRAWSRGSSCRAAASEVFGGCVRRDATETTDVDGLQFAGADECEACGAADTEAAGGLFDGEEYEGGVVVGGGREGAVFVQGSLR